MIEVRNLRKSFGSKLAVDRIEFRVEPGEVLGFLGPNGAGKSTTMRLITGYLPADEGEISLCGISMRRHSKQAKRTFGYLPESAPLYEDMTVEGFLRFCAQIRGLRGKSAHRALDAALDRCFLQGVRRQRIDTLSKGFRHRTCLAQALLHDPQILILDEPTDGLDPNQKHEIRQLIRELGESRAILFSTHILEEVEAVCSRVLVIDQGRILTSGTPDELKAQSPDGTLPTLFRQLTFQPSPRS